MKYVADDRDQNVNQMMFGAGSMPYDMFNYGSGSASYYPSTNPKIAIEYTGSSTLDERDRRRRRSGSTSGSSTKEKDSLTNMHLVSLVSSKFDRKANALLSDDVHKIAHRKELSESERRSM